MEVEKNVLKVVNELPGISRINIISFVGKSEATVKRTLKRLVDLKLLNTEDPKRLEAISVFDINPVIGNIVDFS